MTDRKKVLMNKSTLEIISKIEEVLPDVEVFQDQVSKDEISNGQYNYVIIEFLGFKPQSNACYLTQYFRVNWVSENNSDIGGITLDLITSVKSVNNVSFVESDKQAANIENSDRIIDYVSMEFERTLRIG